MKATLLLASFAIATVVSAAGQVFFEETFSDSNWQNRWTTSSTKDDLGVFALSSGTFYANKDYAQGLQTSQDARFYSISAPFTSVVDNSKDDLIVQYTVKQEVNQECGGSYLKLLPEGFDAKTFNGDSEYAIMFGPDVCGAQNRVHVIFHHEGKNYLTKQEFPVPKDTKTHLYRLTVHPDQKYSLLIDGDIKADHVSLEEHWDVYAPRTIADPNDKKPADWVEEEHIVDESHKKPDNYDQIPKTIPDPEAKRPDEWDEEFDGEWEAPEIDNPDFEVWEAKMIPNPAFKGEWKPAEIPNPDFQEYPSLAHYRIGGIGLDLWQVNSGSIFDDIVVTTDKEVADRYLGQWKENFAMEEKLVAEIEAKTAKEKEEKEKEAKEKEEMMKAEAEAKVAEEEKVATDGFDELDESDEEQPDQNHHDEL
ncbi:Calreticulin-domain-containing protein [Linnemannia elongata AG-77]|uniref:Calreticulin n=1 Tax=Linnemannia elongata AG-77 TaxID=1314771 RepID=A0A197K7P7_9FUNG|nr:Calreticulin-domain-containing protein [Linnemannia elongata AG-77]